MDLSHITYEQVVRTMREVASEKPDYVYKAPEHMSSAGICFYVHTDEAGQSPEPGCLVGTVLHRLGVPLEELRQQENRVAMNLGLHYHMGPLVADFLYMAQRQQDTGRTWAKALAYAEMNH